MNFKVEPSAIRAYASRLDEVARVAADARRYVSAHGNFGIHEAGIIGFAAPGHRKLMSNLQRMLDHLSELGTDSQRSLRSSADGYLRTDEQSAADLDATYPPVTRPRPGSAGAWHD